MNKGFSSICYLINLMVISTAIFAYLIPSVHASDLYYNDGTTTDLVSTIFSNNVGGDSQQNGYDCASCHASTGSACTADGVSQTAFLSYSGVAACISRIRVKVGLGPYGGGGRMPQACAGAGCLTVSHRGLLTTWDGNGEPLSAPSVTTSTATSISKTGATLRATFDPNVWSGTSVSGTYRFNYGLTAIYGSTTSAANITGTSGVLRTTGITGLACGTTYNFRGRVTNGAATVNGSNRTFNTSACTAPVITQGGSTLVVMSEDSTPTAFSLTLNATDNDPGTLNWAIVSAAGNGSASVAGGGTGSSEPFSYTPNLNYTGSDSFQVRLTNSTTGLFDTITVNVTVNPVNDPPVISEGAGPIVRVIDEDNSPTAFLLTLNATDFEIDTLTWSISSAALNGSAIVSGTGLSKVINYAPSANYNGPDSFTVQVFDGASPDTITVNLTVNPRNDAPVITPVGAQIGTEGSLLTVTPAVIDPDDVNNGTDITWSFVSGQQAGMVISNTGVVTWTPPLGPPAIFGQNYPVTIRAADDGSDGAVPDDDTFNITVNPPDNDNDLVADYQDLCLTIPDSTNADNDGDGTAGSDGGANDGGNVCDLDDDNDGIPDTFEIANGLNPLDAADAALDADGDGISNLAEFLAGTNPNFANLTIDSTGYLTPYTLTPPVPTTIAAGATAAVASNTGPYRPGHFDITWTASNSASTNLGTSIQSLDVRPIVSLAPDQQATEASTVNIVATLNGSAATYPVTVNYMVTGTADASDHNAVAGSFVITTPNQMVSLPFNVLADTLNEGLETIIFTMTSVTNAVIGSDATHTVSIVEGNIAPVVSLQFRQGGTDVSTAYVSGGTVTVNAVVTDVNSTQTHTYDWSMSNNSLSAPTDTTSSSWTFTPVAGSDPFENFLIDVNLTDSGVPALSNRVSQILSVVAVAPTLTATDTDGDGTNDDDPTEGLDDSDQDGIPNYLDAQSAGATDQHLIPNQTAATDNATWFLVQTEPGLKIVTGNTARASGNNGILVTDANITNFGSVLGDAPLNANDNFEHVGGIYDFELSGLLPGQTANIVIPLQSVIPTNATFRKFNPNSGWGNFVVDNNNRLASASGTLLGVCPEPGSSQYVAGLIAFNSCLQLTIQDGGANDADGTANGIIKDPGSLGIVLKAPVTPTVRGSGRIDLIVLLGLILLIGFRLASYSGVRFR